MEAAGGAQEPGRLPEGPILDIGTLTWPQREQVLRLAFARINQHSRTMQLRRMPTFGDALRQQLQRQQLPQPDTAPADEGEALQGLVSGSGKPKMA